MKVLEGLWGLLSGAWNALPPVGRKTRPNLASAIGFLFGGLGLAIYFRTVIDLFLPVAFAIVAQLIVWKELGAGFELGWLTGAVIAALYAFFRAQNPNSRVDELAKHEQTAAPSMPHPL
jgi:hypothetical protein